MEDREMAIIRAETTIGEAAAYGGFLDAAGGLATVVLAVVGLTQTAPEMLTSIATIVFGVGLLIQGGTLLSEYSGIVFPSESEAPKIGQLGSGGLSIVFLSGAAGVVLGILALLGIVPNLLTPVAVIAYGAALVLSSGAVWRVYHRKREALVAAHRPTSKSEILANEMAFGSAGIQALAGAAGIVLGILALSGGGNTIILSLVALLALGATLILTGSALSATVLGFMRPEEARTPGE
jgi:hypothetical protein